MRPWSRRCGRGTGGIDVNEPSPPIEWVPGPQEEEILLGAVRGGERLVAPPRPFLVPPFAPFYPLVPKANITQKVTHLLVTDRALYSLALGKTALLAQVRISFERIISAKRSTALRKGTKKGLGRLDEWVYVLLVTMQDGSMIHAECRFVGAAAIGEAIEAGVAQISGGGSGGHVPSMADELAKLSELASKGVLSPDEWERAKALYLGKPPDRRAEDARLLSHLHELRKAGALSESEFNLKKWEILSRS